MQNLGGHGSLARPVGAGNHNQDWAMITCRHCGACLMFLQLLRVPPA